MSNNIALLVDGDNISNRHSSALIKSAHDIGKRLVSRVYGDVTKLPKWEEQPEFQMIHAGARDKTQPTCYSQSMRWK